MSEKNLPIKLVLQKATDTQPNKGGGKIKFFGEVTPALQEEIVGKFDDILAFYEDVFQENDLIPAVGKITVKPEAIAKSHKAKASLLVNNDWKSAFNDHSKIIEKFLPNAIIKDTTTFRKALARVMFFNFLCDLVSYTVPDKYLESVRNETIDILSNNKTKKQGLNKLIWFLDLLGERIKKIHNVSYSSIENYKELAEYAKRDSLYSKDAFHNFRGQGDFSFGIDNTNGNSFCKNEFQR